MKKFLLSVMLIALAAGFANAQEKKIKEALVPQAVLDTFKVKYKKLPVDTWYESDGGYAAVFDKGESTWKAYYGNDGTWKKSSSRVKEEAVSGAVKKSIKNTEWKDWKMGECYKVETPEYKKLFELHMKKGKEKKILVFDPLGKAMEIK